MCLGQTLYIQQVLPPLNWSARRVLRSPDSALKHLAREGYERLNTQHVSPLGAVHEIRVSGVGLNESPPLG
jgi:hypothetical protein